MPEFEDAPEDLLGSRRRAREFAFRVLFESLEGGSDPEDVWMRTIAAHIRETKQHIQTEAVEPTKRLEGETLEFAHQLVHKYSEDQERIDALLTEVIEGWTFSQMAKTDLTVLRLSTTEMLLFDTPRAAIIEVAVRIAKKYGGEDSGRFVNGVLARLKRHLEQGARQVRG